MGSTNRRVVLRMMMAIAVTVLAALLLYFVFLHGSSRTHGEVQRIDQQTGSLPTSVAEDAWHQIRVSA